MTPILPGRYLARVEKVKVKRARAGHSYISWGLRIQRSLTTEPHAWIGLTDAAVCNRCGTTRKIVGHLPDPSDGSCSLREAGNKVGDLVEAIMSSRARGFENDLHDAGRACGVLSMSLPTLTTITRGDLQDHALQNAEQQAQDGDLRTALEPLLGKLVTVDAHQANTRSYRADPFVATAWTAPNPVDLMQHPTLPEALALLAHVWRTLKQEGVRYQERVDDVLRLLESLEVPR